MEETAARLDHVTAHLTPTLRGAAAGSRGHEAAAQVTLQKTT